MAEKRSRFLPGDPRVEEPYRLTPQLALRVAVLGFLALTIFAVLFLRLWALQVLSGDKYLAEAIRKQERELRNAILATVRGSTFGGFGGLVLDQTNRWLQNVSMIANYKVLQAMLALEAGDTGLAARSCEEALSMNNGQPFEFESKMIATNYLRLLKQAGAVK